MSFFNKVQKKALSELQKKLDTALQDIQKVIEKHNLNTYEVMDLMLALQNGVNFDTAGKMKVMSEQNNAMRQTLIDNGLLKSQEGVNHT